MSGRQQFFVSLVLSFLVALGVGCRHGASGGLSPAEQLEQQERELERWDCRCWAEERGESPSECTADGATTDLLIQCTRRAYLETSTHELAEWQGCLASAGRHRQLCIEAAGCDDDRALDSCWEAWEEERASCPEQRWEVVQEYELAREQCLVEQRVGSPSGCPDEPMTTTAVGQEVFRGDTTGMGDDFETYCGSSGAPDVSMLWTAPAAGVYVIDTVGSDFDTVLNVLAGCDGEHLACNDDWDSLQSQVELSLSADQQVVIVVDGYSGSSSGQFVVNITSL